MWRRARRLLRVAVTSLALGVALVLVVTSPWVVRHLGGNFASGPGRPKVPLSDRARRLVRESLRGLDPARIVDAHVHVLAMGTDVAGAYVNASMRTWARPVRTFRYLIYRSAVGIEQPTRADAEFRDRLVALAGGLPRGMRLNLLAFDQTYRPDGQVDRAATEFYTPNGYVFELASAHPDRFLPVMSVHPYRSDAIEALRRWAARGGHFVKWLPSAMGIDPADPRLDRYYDEMRSLGLVLLTHAGEELAVEGVDDQSLGNPLRLRRALDHGVRVVVAHCASLGDDVDLDDPAHRRVPAFDLFLRLMDDPRYQGLVYGDISALTQLGRVGRPLEVLLERQDLHPRLLYASDYPVPAINALIDLEGLAGDGFLDTGDVAPLRELYAHNPLLFHLVLSRRLRHPRSGAHFSDAVFQWPAGLP